MSQTYVYRKHLRAPFKTYLLMEVLMFSTILIMTLGLVITNNKLKEGILPYMIGIITLIMFAIITIELVIIYIIFVKRFRSISVELTDTAIVYKNSMGDTIIPYEDIQKMEFPSIKYTGGWVKIIHKTGNIRLTVVLENIGKFICELKEKMNERDMNYVYNKKKLFSFYKTAVFAEESWERIYGNYKIQIGISYFSMIMTTVLLYLFDSSLNNQFILGSLFAPLFGYILSEIIIGVKVKKRVERDSLSLLPRDTKFENSAFMVSMMTATIGYLLIVLINVL